MSEQGRGGQCMVIVPAQWLSRLIQNYGDVFSLGCRSQAFGIELGEESL